MRKGGDGVETSWRGGAERWVDGWAWCWGVEGRGGNDVKVRYSVVGPLRRMHLVAH